MMFHVIGMTEEEIGNLSQMPFPSFQSTFYQNFILAGRSESQRQRTWPTDPQFTGGFYFI